MRFQLRPRTDKFVVKASDDLSVHLHRILRRYGKGKITAKELKDNLEQVLYTTLYQVEVYGYENVCRIAGLTPDNGTKLDISNEAKDRASYAAEEITRVSKIAVLAAMSKKRVTSKSRANTIAQYESDRIFFRGSKKAIREWKAILKKGWITTGANPCEDCLDNEDDGYIPMGEAFQSGDLEPLAHINCECYLDIEVVQ